MPDYASILRRSVSALPDPSPEMREAVYQRARAALGRQLTAVEPPLSNNEIEAQHQELEDAIMRLEADYAPPPEVLSPPSSDIERDAFFEGGEPEANFAVPAAVVPMSAERRAETHGMETSEPDDEDDFEDEADERSGRLPLLLGLLFLAVVVLGIAAYAYAERGRIAGLFGHGAPRQTVANAARPADATAPTPAEPANAAADAAAAQKRIDRLTNGSDVPAEQQPGPADSTPADSTTADATPAGDTPAATAPAESVPAESAPAESAPAEAAPAEAAPGGEAASAATAPSPAASLPAESPAGLQSQPAPTAASGDENIVAQKAIYYFQGTQGSPGKASDGTVTWSQVTRDNAPAIQATLRLGEQNATVVVTIYKNNDSGLPASHLVEVQFTGKLSPSAIERVPALVLKQTEQARGQPLTGAAVPVTGDLFWIALSNDAQQVKHNLDLLHEGSWFDLPILFSDQTRALLTFEKGVPGDKVFETVLAGWKPPA